MTTTKKLTSLGILVAGSTLWLHGQVPKSWFLAGNARSEYTSGVDPATVYNSLPSAYLKAANPVQGFGTLMQEIESAPYRGKRIRFSAFVKTDALQNWAGLWARVDKGHTSVSFDNMQNRPIKGTTGWNRYEVVLDVPDDATGIAFGILVDGSGTAWINAANFEVVGADVRTTSMLTLPQTAPSNLSFEQ